MLFVDAVGRPVAPVAKINAGIDADPIIFAQRPSGEMVLVWSAATPRYDRDFGYMAQAFDAEGRLSGRPFVTVPPAPADSAQQAVAALGADGTLAVVSTIYLGSAATIELRTFAAGRPAESDAWHRLAGPIVVLRSTSLTEAPAVAVDAAGRVLVVWSELDAGIDPPSPVLRARLFDRRGVPLSEAIDVAANPGRDRLLVCVRAAAAGDRQWVINWSATQADQGYQIFVRRLAGP